MGGTLPGRTTSGKRLTPLYFRISCITSGGSCPSAKGVRRKFIPNTTEFRFPSPSAAVMAATPGASPVPSGPAPVPPGPVPDPDVDPLPRGRFFCRLCHVSAANLPSLGEHLGGKRHRRLRELREERREQGLRSLFVSGFPRGTAGTELGRHFGKFGDIATVVMDKEKGAYAIVEFQEASGRDRALAEPEHELGGGHRLRVRPREQKTFASAPRGQKSPRDPQDPQELERVLCQVSDVDSQLQLLVELLGLSEDERRLRDLLVSLFQEVFTEFFPGCSVVPFGSSVNGFDTRGCDLDLLLELEPTQDPKSGVPPGSAPPEESLLSELDPGSPGEVLELMGSILRRCVPGVLRVRTLPGARRPVVKFCHKPSGLCGDLSLDNRLALLNTQFLKFSTQMDGRVRPLAYALRLWAKQQNLAGNPSGGGGPLLTNYALTLLLLFFLQTRSPPVLPSLQHLRDLAEDEDRVLVGGWDCTFPRDTAKLEPSANTQSSSSLLAEFFHVFGDFDFGGRVISLREGRALPLPLPEAPPKGLKLGPFNLQDPFELSHNVAANVNAKTATRFSRCCRAAAKYCRSLQYRQKSTKGRSWGVTRLFHPGGVEPAAPNAGGFTIPIVADATDATEPRGRWFREVCGAVVFVLREVLKCEVTPGEGPGGEQGETGAAVKTGSGLKRHLDETTEGPGKKPRLEGPVVEATNWSCLLRHRVWRGRRRLRRELRHGEEPEEGDEEALELEKGVSEAILRRDKEGAEPLLCFEARARPAGARRVLLSFHPLPPGPLFQDFFSFLRSFLPLMVCRCMGEGGLAGEARRGGDPTDEGDEEGASVS